MTQYKRRKYFIDIQFQTKFVVLTVLGLLLYTLLFLAIIFLPTILPIGSSQPLEEQVEAARALLLLHTYIWPAVGIVIVVMGVVSIFVSHKIAGPVYRLSTSLKQVTDGDLSVNIKLRKGDDLQFLAEQINVHLDELRDFVHRLKDDYQRLTLAIEQIESRNTDASCEKRIDTESIEQLRESQKKLAATLRKFNLD